MKTKDVIALQQIDEAVLDCRIKITDTKIIVDYLRSLADTLDEICDLYNESLVEE